mmetsp:Transcript_2880/g.8670  ORF Transcript_2880/g.8670 Transcript_2880/m.8670 type:complete len:412 (-) Transcript_2880:41-1276(-)
MPSMTVVPPISIFSTSASGLCPSTLRARATSSNLKPIPPTISWIRAVAGCGRLGASAAGPAGAAAGAAAAAAAAPGKPKSRLEALEPRKDLPPLLRRASDVKPEKLDWLGVSFGLTPRLFKFWKTAGYVPLYLRQNANELTGERSIIMVKPLARAAVESEDWIERYWLDFRRRFVTLLGISLRDLNTGLVLSMLGARKHHGDVAPLSKEELEARLTPYDLKRLRAYTTSVLDYHAILDVVPALANLWLEGRIGGVTLSAVQRTLLVGIGFLHKSVDEVAADLGGVKVSQLMALFAQVMRKFDKHFRELRRDAIAHKVPEKREVSGLEPLPESLDKAQAAAAAAAADTLGFSMPNDDAFTEALAASVASTGEIPSSISVKSSKKKSSKESKRRAESSTRPGSAKKHKKKHES